MKFIPKLDVNFLDSTQIVDGRTNGRTDKRTNGRKVEPLYRTLLNAGAIKMFQNSLESFLTKNFKCFIYEPCHEKIRFLHM